MMKSKLDINKKDSQQSSPESSPEIIKFGESKFEEEKRREWLKSTKPRVYEKVLRFNDKLAKGEGVPIIQFQYNYACNFKCKHCSIEKFQISRKEELESGRRYFKIDDVKKTVSPSR